MKESLKKTLDSQIKRCNIRTPNEMVAKPLRKLEAL